MLLVQGPASKALLFLLVKAATTQRSMLVKYSTPEELSERNADGMTPLAVALATPHSSMGVIEYLMETTRDWVSFVAPDGRTTLALLAVLGEKPPELLTQLVRAGVPYAKCSTDPESSLLYAAVVRKSIPMIQHLVMVLEEQPWRRSATEPALVGIFCEELLASTFASDNEDFVKLVFELFEKHGLEFSRVLGVASRHRLLCAAVEHAMPSVVEYLLNRNAPIELDDDESVTGRDRLLASREGSSAVRIAMERSYFMGEVNFKPNLAASYTKILIEFVARGVAAKNVAYANTVSARFGSLMLHAAVKLRSRELVDLLIRAGADVNNTGRLNSEGEPCGMLATVLLENRRWDSITERLLEARASPTACDRHGMTPLHRVCHTHALASDKGKVITRLVKAKADVNAIWQPGSLTTSVRFMDDTHGITPLMMAVMNHANYSVKQQQAHVTKLLECEADTNLTGHIDNRTPLLVLCSSGLSCGEHRELAEQLLEHGADVNAAELSTGRSAWSYMLQHARYSETLIRKAINCGAAINHSPEQPLLDSDRKVVSPLNLAARYLDTNHLSTLLDAGANVNYMSPTGCTPLSDAIRFSWGNSVELLLRRGALPNMQRFDASTPKTIEQPYLLLAVSQGLETATASLLRYGADANVRDAEGRSALHLAVARGSSNLVSTLLEQGATQRHDNQLRTPLANAIEQRLARDIIALLSYPFYDHCTICAELEELQPLTDCGHAFCRSCLASWTTTHASGLGSSIMCPFSRCGKEMAFEDVRKALPDHELFIAYDRRLTELCCNQWEDFAWCPRCSAGGIVMCAETICSQCNYRWCGFCRSDAHPPGERCATEDNVISVLRYKRENTRSCPGCRVATEHNGGCSHMVRVSLF